MIFVLLVRCCCINALSPLQTDTIDKPPVPYLAADGSIPKEHKDHKVFLDPNTGNGIVLFPTADSGNKNASQRISVELNRHVDPSIEVRTSYDPDSKLWEYRYTFTNGQEAKQAAVSWYFKGLTKDNCKVSLPEEWDYLFPVVLRNPDWPRLVIGAKGSPTKTILQVGVPPKKKVAGFVLRSALSPGFEEIYVQGMAHVTALPQEPDDDIASELTLICGFPYNFKRTQTFIPKVVSSETNQVIAQEYHKEIQQCRNDQQCSEDFAKAATDFLRKPSFKNDTDGFHNLESRANSSFEKEFAKIVHFLMLSQ